MHNLEERVGTVCQNKVTQVFLRAFRLPGRAAW